MVLTLAPRSEARASRKPATRDASLRLFMRRLLLLVEEGRLRSLAPRLGEPEMAESVRRQQASARRPLHETELDEVGLDDVFDGVARLGERGGDRLDADRTAG